MSSPSGWSRCPSVCSTATQGPHGPLPPIAAQHALDRIRNRRVNERTGKEVGPGDIVKGYEVGEGEYVVVEPEELNEIAPGRSQTLEITDFVDLDRIAPVYFRPHLLRRPRAAGSTSKV